MLDLAPAPITPARRAADELRRRERLADGLQHRLGRRQVRCRRRTRRRGRTTRPPSPVARGQRRLQRPGARVGARGQAGCRSGRASSTTIPPRAPLDTAATCRRLPVVALFGPTGVGKTAVAIALADRLRADGEDPVAVSADALQIYARARGPHRRGERRRAGRLEHRLLGVPCPSTRRSAPASTRASPTRRSTGCSPPGRRPIVVGGTGLYLRAALAELDLRPPRPRGRARAPPRRDSHERGRARAARRARRARRRGGRRRSRRPTAQRLVRALELLDAGHAAARRPEQLWTADDPPPDAAGRPDDGARGAERPGSTRACDAMVAAGAAEEVRARRRPPAPRATVRKALGFQRAAGRRRRRDAAQHPPLRAPPAHLDAQAARRAPARHHRPRPGATSRPSCTPRCLARHDPPVRFEKWQALGNDYLIVERAALPLALTPARSSGCAIRTSAPAATACSSCRRRRARLRRAPAHLQPRRLGGRAVRQRRARGDPVPAPRRLDRTPTRSRSRPRPGRSGPRSPARRRAGRHGPRRADVRRTTRAARPTAPARSRARRFQHVSIGNPQCAIRVPDRDALESLDLAAIGPRDRARAAVPEPHQHVVLDRDRPEPHPRPDLRARRGGDAVVRHRRVRRRRRPRAARRRLARHRRARRRRADRRRRRVAARRPHRLGRPRLRAAS